MCCSVKWSQTSAHPLQYVIYSKFFFFYYYYYYFFVHDSELRPAQWWLPHQNFRAICAHGVARPCVLQI